MASKVVVKDEKAGVSGIRIDASWKYLLKEFFEDFVAFALPEAHGLIDWSVPPVFLDKELSEVITPSKTGALFVDALVRIQLKTGEAEEFLAHIEVQAQHEPKFSERIAIYNCRLFDRHRIPITSLAVYLDEDASWKPCYYERKSVACALAFSYPILKLTDFVHRKEWLQQQTNIFAHVMLFHLMLLEEKKAGRTLENIKAQLFRFFLGYGFEKDIIGRLAKFLDLLIALNKTEAVQFKAEMNVLIGGDAMYEYISTTQLFEMDEKIEKARQEGREEVREEVREEGKRVIRPFLEKKFGPLPESVLNHIEIAGHDHLLKLLDRAITAKTLTDIFDA